METLTSYLISFILTLLIGKALIPLLRQLKAGQSIKEIGPSWHMSKQGTPTMGGLMFVVGIGVAVVVVGLQLQAGASYLFVYLLSVIFGLIGMVDDVQKIRHKANDGLTALQKLLLQLAVSLAFVVLMRYYGELTPNLYLPFLNINIPLSWGVYMGFSAFVMVATVNAVNLTDGVDGLASGVTIPVMLFFVAVGLWNGRVDLAMTAAAMTGGISAFLCYNFHPAKVFMGDTGSLFLGGAVCGLAFAFDMPMIIPVIGLIYVLEALSDVIQVLYFKATKGKRFFRMAPLHHHFEMGGWSEKKLFFIFSGVTAILCVIAFYGVMNRYPM
ncbi:MAG: phospho-N-acetylmuramoyl-pentapeptide-transferase [Eubacteriales bacterium]